MTCTVACCHGLANMETVIIPASQWKISYIMSVQAYLMQKNKTQTNQKRKQEIELPCLLHVHVALKKLRSVSSN